MSEDHDIRKFKKSRSGWTEAFQYAVSESQEYDLTNDDGSSNRGAERSAQGTKITVAPLDKGERYYIEERIELPGNKNISIEGTVHSGAYIQTVSGVDYAFRLGTGWGAKEICKLFFNKCGVEIQQQVRSPSSVHDCKFDSTPDYAIKSPDEGVVGLYFYENWFNRCTGGIGILGKSSDNISIYRNHMTRLAGYGVRALTSGVRIDNNFFENKSSLNRDPHIAVEPDGAFSGGISRIERNRFGLELGNGDGPPDYTIRIGPEEPTTGTMSEVHIHNNEFRGTPSGGLTPGQRPIHAIRCTKAINKCTWIGNYFDYHESYLVQFDGLTTTTYNNNYWLNTVGNEHVAGIFSVDGRFTVIDSSLQTPAVIHFGQGDLDASTTATRYMTPGWDTGTASANIRAVPMTRDGVIRNMEVNARAAGVDTRTINTRILVNGVSTDLLVAVTNDNADQSGSDTTHSVAVVRGDMVSVRVTKSGSGAFTSTAQDVAVSFELF